MNTHFTYLFILLGALFFPFLIGFKKSVPYNKSIFTLFIAFTLTSVLFVTWDCIFTVLGVWGFNDKYVSGIRLFNLPVEEVAFFYIIPYCCLLIYESLKHYVKLRFQTKWLSYLLSVVLLIFMIIFYQRLYTLSALLLGMILLLFIAGKNYDFLPYFYIMFLISMIPFLIVNGLLTGTYLDEPVVWYNNIENSSYRLLTIPYEDIVYGFDLLLMNTIIYEYLKGSKARLLKNQAASNK